MRGLEDVRMRCMDRCKWRLFCRVHPLERVPRNMSFIISLNTLLKMNGVKVIMVVVIL